MWQGWLIFGMGAWLVVSGIRPDFIYPLNLIVSGFVVTVLGLSAFKNAKLVVSGGIGIVTLLIGIFAGNSQDIFIAYYIIGAVLFVLGLWGAAELEFEHLTMKS